MPIGLRQWNTTRFVLKHLAASSAIVAGSGALAGVWWLATYLRGTMTSNGSDPAVTFAATVFGALASATVSAALVLLPATAVAEWIATRARLRTLWQIPVAALTIVVIGVCFGAITAVTNQPSFVFAPGRVMTAAAPQLAALVVYCWALQSADWLLRTGVRAAGWLLPARFGALARAQDSATSLVSRSRGRFRVKEHFTFEEGATSVLVLSGNVIEGDVRSGMRACTTVNARELSARIQSVESSGSIGDGPSLVGLLLPLNDAEMRIWQAATREGSVVRIE